MPEGLDAAYWDSQSGIKTAQLMKDLNDLKTFKAEADVRQAGIPPSADQYALSLEGWTPPEGVDAGEVAIKEDHPLIAPAKEFAHKWGLPQEAFADLAKLHANYVAGEVKTWNANKAAEMAKLGEKGSDRVSAVSTALLGRLGEAAKPLLGLMVSAAVVQSFESLLRVTAAPGPSARNGGKPALDTSKMSPRAKFNHFLSAGGGTGQH
jgi:hypothetical protein